MSDNGDPDNFAGTLLSCDNIQTGSNAARWCDKTYDALVESAVGERSQARAKLYEQAQEIFISRRHGSPATGKTFYATRSNVSGYTVSMMGAIFQSEAELSERRTGWHIWMRLSSKSMTPGRGRYRAYE